MDARAAQETIQNLDRLEWSDEPFTLLQLIESLEMPQMIKVVRTSTNELHKNDYILLQSVYDRYVLLGHQLDGQHQQTNLSYMIPDWYRAQCKIVTSNPRIQKQFWNFQGAAEINRFDLPREINFLVETPLYQFSKKHGDKSEWKRVCLKRNTRLVAKQLHQYSSNRVAAAGFLLQDKQGLQYLLPSDLNVKFSVQIQQDEYNNSYFDHKKAFTLPEIITRYELPVNIEFTPHSDGPNPIPASKLPQGAVKISAVAIAKSVIGILFNSQTKTARFVELSPATPFDLAIPKCLQKGLKNPNAALTPREESQYALYNDTREKVLGVYSKQCELFKYDLKPAEAQEREAMMKIFEAGRKYKHEETTSLQTNYLLNLSSNDSVNPDAKIPFLNLRNVFLRPNIDEGDPYDDVNHDQEGEDGEQNTAAHDLSSLNQMPERLYTDN